MPTKYYEKGEYFIKEKETVNGVSREWEDVEEWSRGDPVGTATQPRRIEPGRDWSDQRWTATDGGRIRDRELWEDRDRERDPWASRFALPDCFPPRGRSQSRASSRFADRPTFGDRGFEEIRRSKSIDRNLRDLRDSRESTRDFYSAIPSHSTTPTYRNEAPYYSIQQKDRLSDYGGSRHELRHVTSDPVSRPGSPGPVAGVGDIVNTEHGFTIQLDVNHFRPEDIRVVLTGDTLTVNGERCEEAGAGQTLRRSFQRKYSIPTDIKLDSIVSHLTDNGFLVINGSRRGWKETQISVHGAPSYHQRGSSIISNV